MAFRPFFLGAARSRSLRDLWAALWASQEERLEIEAKLSLFHQSGLAPTSDEIFECLRGATLFCGAVDLLWGKVKTEESK